MWRIFDISKKILREFVYGGHLLSLGASGIGLAIAALYGLPFNWFVLIIPYFSSQVIYTYNHLRELDHDGESNPERVQHLRKQKALGDNTLVIYILALVISLLFTNLSTIAFVIFVLLGGILYTIAFKKRLARISPVFKTIYVSIFWALSVFLIPLLNQIEITGFFVIMFIFVFLRFVVSTAFFDLKDITSDRIREIKTLATLLGRNKTIYLLLAFNIISLLPLFLGISWGYLPQQSIILGASVIYALLYLILAGFVGEKSLRYVSYLVVDGEYILWPLGVLLIKLFYR